jgi:hypothetical protein
MEANCRRRVGDLGRRNWFGFWLGICDATSVVCGGAARDNRFARGGGRRDLCSDKEGLGFGAGGLDLFRSLVAGYSGYCVCCHEQAGVFIVQKCPLCDKKTPRDAKFCPHCGWDLTAHELAPAQIARIQEEILEARFRGVYRSMGMVTFEMAGLVFMTLSLLALREVIVVHATWVLSGIAVAFWSVAVAFAFLRLRDYYRQNRLKMMLRDRQLPQ